MTQIVSALTVLSSGAPRVARARTDWWGTCLVVLGLFAVQLRVSAPLLPPSIVRSRVRGTSYLVMFLAAVGMFSVYLFLAYYLQRTLGFSPALAGVAFLPMAVSVAIGSAGSSGVLVPRFGLRVPVTTGALRI